MADPQLPTDERGMACSFLDWNRGVVEVKALGLDRDGATSVATPTGLTVLGLVVHLAWVEHFWFRHRLLGEPGSDLDVAGSFAIAPDLTVEGAVADYRTACERSREAMADLSFDTVAALPDSWLGPITLRWIVTQLNDETSRHLGHLDILREMTDGQVGDG